MKKKKDEPEEVIEIKSNLPAQCPRCALKGHEPNETCDAGK